MVYLMVLFPTMEKAWEKRIEIAGLEELNSKKMISKSFLKKVHVSKDLNG